MKKSTNGDRQYVDKKNQKGEWIDILINAARKAKVGLPICTMNPKREETCQIRFTGLLRHVRMAEEIYDSIRAKRKQYKTVSDVNRAAYYLGLELLYWSEKDKLPESFPPWGSGYANSVRRLESMIVDLEQHDISVKLIGTAYDYFKKGSCSQQEFHEAVMGHINDCPERFRNSLNDAYKRILNSESVTSIQSGSYHGGDHKSRKYADEN